MDWLSKRKFVIVCHEKVVRIPLEGDEILRVHGERTQGVVKTLMNTKVDEPKLSNISVVRNFIDLFPKDLSMATASTSCVPYRLSSWSDAGREVSISFGTLRNARIVWATSRSKEEHEVHLKLGLESLRKEKLYSKFFLTNIVGDALSGNERVKSRRVRGMILAAQSEAFKQKNVLVVGSVMDEAHASSPEARIHTRIELLDLEFLDSVIQCFYNPCQRAITKLVYFVEPHDLSFIVVDRKITARGDSMMKSSTRCRITKFRVHSLTAVDSIRLSKPER
ncbi:hypothetical protein Tco_1211036 [Tanacetum coccineum]